MLLINSVYHVRITGRGNKTHRVETRSACDVQGAYRGSSGAAPLIHNLGTGLSGQLHAPAALTGGKGHRYRLTRRLGGPQSRSERFTEEKISSCRDFFCTLFVFRPYLCLLSWLFHILSLLTTHSTNIHNSVEIRTCNPSKRSVADSLLKTSQPLKSAGIRTPAHPASSLVSVHVKLYQL